MELSEEILDICIMDAIDGTTNAMRGIPFYYAPSTDASDYKMSSITDAVVMDLEQEQDFYTSSKDKGSFLNLKNQT